MIMDFLEEQFSSKENLDLDDLNSQLPKLKNQLETSQKEVSSYLDSVKDKLEEQPKKNESQINELNQLKNDFSSISSTLRKILEEDVPRAENSFSDFEAELEEVTDSISIVHNISEIHERLATLKNLCENYSDYGLAFEVCDVLKVLMKTFPVNCVQFIEDLRKIVDDEVKKVHSLFRREYKKNCVLSKEKNFIIIKVPKNTSILPYFYPVIYQNECIIDLLKSLTNFITDMYMTVIKNKCKIIQQTSNNFQEFKIEITDTKTNDKYEEVYTNVISITNFLEKYMNCDISDDSTVLNFIGTAIKSQLAKSIIKECILKSIPQQYSVLEEFKTVLIQSTKELEEKLSPHGMFDEEWNNIKKIDEYHKQNRCKYYTDKAMEIMKKDLHNVVQVGKPFDPKEAFIESNEFLLCSISSNIVELIALGQELITEMSEGPVENCKDLFTTYKNIFFNYGDFVASHHQKLLETIPQQVALFYNNCRYLSLKLKTWDEMFENHEVISEFCDDSAKAFYEIEEVGRVFLTSFVDDQKKQIVNILNETNLQNEKSLEKLEENTEKLFRQCLRQQELLKTVWGKVLSYPVYNETIGDILNSMCTFLIDSLCAVEDIEARVAENLIELFKIVLNRGTKLFTDPNEVSLYVLTWHKFNELIFVLGASLVDINDRWADGKGPLALHFKPYELKQLIRAIFQNTERRAAVLAKIHE